MSFPPPPLLVLTSYEQFVQLVNIQGSIQFLSAVFFLFYHLRLY